MQASFFNDKNRLQLLQKLGDPLPRLDRTVDWQGSSPTTQYNVPIAQVMPDAGPVCAPDVQDAGAAIPVSLVEGANNIACAGPMFLSALSATLVGGQGSRCQDPLVSGTSGPYESDGEAMQQVCIRRGYGRADHGCQLSECAKEP